MANVKKINNKVQKTPEDAQVKRAIKVPQQLYRITTDMSKFRQAVVSAEDLHNPQRFNLYQLYQQTMLDAHVTACYTQRKNLLLSCDFNVYSKDGVESEEKSKIIETKWFRDFIGNAFDSLFWGYSLMQFEDVVKMYGIEQFREVELVPRIYVKPEFHRVVHSAADTAGVDYTELPYSDWCIGVGQKRDLGLLLKITPLVIWKKNALGAWAEFIEKFGSPIRIGKTDSNDLQSVNNMENMLKNMGVASWGLFKTDDLIELHESKHSDAFQVFNEMIERCNSEISKLILGQTGTMDEKAHVGSAEVHERILKQLAEADKQFIYTVNNTQLLPMMNNLGFGLDGMFIDVEQEDEFNLEQKSKFDIELIKTGKFTFDPAYIKEKYGTEVIPVAQPVDQTELVNYKKDLSKYYS